MLHNGNDINPFIAYVAKHAFDEIVISEDDEHIREGLVDASEKMGFGKITSFSTNQELQNEARQGTFKDKRVIFSIDVEDGGAIKKSGVQASKVVKKLSSKGSRTIFLSSKLQTLEKEIQISAADGVVEKTNNMEHNISSVLQKAVAKINEEVNIIDNSDELDLNEDINVKKFHRLMKDPDWVKEHKGKYVAIVEGEFYGENDDKKLLIFNLREVKSEILIEQVGNPLIVDLITPFNLLN